MARTLFSGMVLRKFSEITNNKPISTQYNIFCNYEYFFFQSAFWSLFNHHQGSQSNQKQCSLCCGSRCFRVLLCTHYGPWQCFWTYFCKLKEIGVFSCDYGSIDDRKNEQLLNFDIITPQIPTCKAPNRFRKSYNVKYFKVTKCLKRLQKTETYLESKSASMMEPFCEYT